MFTTTLAPVVDAHMLNYSLNDLVVLLLGCAKVRPSQVLELSDDLAADNVAVRVFLAQFQPSFD